MSKPAAIAPFVTYHGGALPVEIGDHVRTRFYLLFRKQGRVVYVPGISAKNSRMEHSGLRWIGIRTDDGLTFGELVDPETGSLLKRVVLLKKDSSPVAEIKPRHAFIDS